MQKKLGLSLVDFNGATCRSRTGILCMASRYNSHYTNAAYEVLKLEPHAGVEPASSAWQADIIAIIRMRHMKF